MKDTTVAGLAFATAASGGGLYGIAASRASDFIVETGSPFLNVVTNIAAGAGLSTAAFAAMVVGASWFLNDCDLDAKERGVVLRDEKLPSPTFNP